MNKPGYKGLLFMLLFTSLWGSSCAGTDKHEQVTPVKAEGVGGVRIAWDYSSAKCIARTGGYARVIRIKDGTLLAVYEDRRGSVMITRSSDNGVTWSTPLSVFPKFSASKDGATTDVNIANAEIVQLKDGSLIMGCNQRPAVAEIYPFAIAVSRSTDNGLTWSTPSVIYRAAPRFSDGCWEPAFLQLPDGTVQVYFANENPYQQSSEQEISMLSSADGGISWSSKPVTVSFRADRRDGMPVPLIVGDEILVSIEDNKADQFKPYIVRSKIANCWSEPVLANSSQRSSALKEPLADNIYAGAPYIIRIPSGEVLLSYQTTGGRSTDWELSTMEVAVGDKSGYSFTNRTRPFDVPLDKEAKWNSLSCFDASTILAVASSNFDGGDVGVWIKKGYIISEQEASARSITVDGIPQDQEWGGSFPLFVGSMGSTNMRASIATSSSSLVFGVKVKDSNLYADAKDYTKSDGVSFYIDADNSCYTTISSSCYKVWCSYKGDVKLFKGDNGRWTEVKQTGIAAKTVLSDSNDGYTAEVAIPFSLVNLTGKAQIRVTAGLSAFVNSFSGYEEPVVNSTTNQPNTWCRVILK